MAELKVFSIVINWDDDDREQGTYGDTVRAVDSDKAERIVRARMAWTHWGDYWDRETETRSQSIASHRDRRTGQLFGSVVECSEGASWKAVDMERALRDILASADANDGGSLRNAIEAAREIIAEIDAI